MARKIMFFTPSLSIGGIERVFITYANELSKHNLVYYVYTHDAGKLVELLDSSVIKLSLGNVRLRHSFISLVKVIKNYMPDFLITGGDVPNCFCILANYMAHKKTKVIISHHNYFNVEHNKLLSTLLMKFLYNRASAIISVSDGITEFLKKNGAKKEKIYTIYNPIDISLIREKSNEFKVEEGDYLVSVGRLSNVKNLPMMIDAFKIVISKYPNLKLLLVGDGEERDRLKNYIRKKSLLGKVILYGSLSNPFPLLSNAKLVLSSSLSEALPTVILEAFVLGKTVVATPTYGAVDLLQNGSLGYISNSLTEVNDFANKIFSAYEQPFNVKMLQEKAEQFSIVAKTKELDFVLDNC